MDNTEYLLEPKKQIALAAHDNKKTDLIEWARWNKAKLMEHAIYATGTTGRLLEEELGIPVIRFQSGPLGGDQQIGVSVSVLLGPVGTSAPRYGCKGTFTNCSCLEHLGSVQPCFGRFHDIVPFDVRGV